MTTPDEDADVQVPPSPSAPDAPEDTEATDVPRRVRLRPTAGDEYRSL